MKTATRIAGLTAFAIVLTPCQLNPQVADRYFDEPETTDQLVITVLYPSLYPIESIRALRAEGFFPSEGVIVVGAYHEAEVTDYESSKEYVIEEGLDWFRFHKIEGDLNTGNLFQENASTSDFEKIFLNSDGIIFFGGADIPPETYGEKTDLLTGIRTPFRHYMELSLAFHLLGGSQNDDFEAFLERDPEFPILGICLGEQTINVGAGGSLYQDIWSETYGLRHLEDVVLLGSEEWHNNPLDRLHPLDSLLFYSMHGIRLDPQSKFVAEMGFDVSDTPFVVSAHHQAVEELGKGMRVIATSLDGKVVEAIDHAAFPNVLGIQFHPEFDELYDPDFKARIEPDDVEFSPRSILENNPPSYEFHRSIWSWFIEKTRAHRWDNE